MTVAADYFRALERRLDCPKDIRKNFLTKTRRTAEDFLQEKPDATQQDLEDFLGEPEELAQGFLETLDPDILGRYRKRKKFFLCSFIAALVILLVVVGTWCIQLWSTPKTMEVTETTIIYY